MQLVKYKTANDFCINCILLFLSFCFLIINIDSSIAQVPPTTLPSKKEQNTIPDEISPKKGELDPLKKYLNNKNQTEEVINGFVGVIQFVKGDVKWTESHPDRPIQFKTLFNWGDSIELNNDAYLKLISLNRCIGITYGPSQLLVPQQNGDLSWVLNSGSARWICPNENKELIRINGLSLQIRGGEIFYHNNLLYVIKGQVISNNGELIEGQTYQFDNSKIVTYYNKEELFHSWKFNQNLPHPVESFQFEQPLRNIKSRWGLSVMNGPADFYHPNTFYNIEDSEGHGIKIQSNFLWKKYSIIADISFFEINNNNDNEYSNFNISQTHNRFESLVPSLGIRFKHNRDWSWFAKFGIGFDKFHVDANSNSGHIRRDINGQSGRISFGIDKYFFEEKLGWGGLAISIEAYFHQNLKINSINKYPEEFVQNDSQELFEDQYSKYDITGVLISFTPSLIF